MRKKFISKNFGWVELMQTLLIFISVGVVVLPQVRTREILIIFSVLLVVNFIAITYQGLKSGRLKMTPAQIYNQSKAGKKLEVSGFETVSGLASIVAVIVLACSRSSFF